MEPDPPSDPLALAAARARPPDLVIADVEMPGLDGVSLVRELRADSRLTTVPVLLVSGRAGEDSRVEGLQAGATDYLVKPFSARELVAKAECPLLDVSRIASGRLPLSLEEVDLAAVATGVVGRLDPSEQAQITCVCEETRGRWDRARLEQVVTNLVTNALKFGEGKPIEVVVKAHGEGATFIVDLPKTPENHA